ncbi:hypothetical protein DD684_05625, partial [Bifidobacterium bifidum]
RQGWDHNGTHAPGKAQREGHAANRNRGPPPLSAPIILVKLRVEIAVLGNSPCEIAVLSSKNGDFTRGIADFGYFTP